MTTVLRVDGLRVVIYPNDHRPAHVHVMNRECEVVFNLNCPDGPPVVRENYRFSQKQVMAIAETLQRELPKLCADWGNIHGQY